MEGTSSAPHECRNAGVGYLELMRQCAAVNDRVTAGNEDPPIRTDWATMTVYVSITPAR